MKFPVPKTLVGANSPIILTNWALGIGVMQYPMGTPRRKISACWSLVNFLICLGFVKMANFSELVEVEGFKIAGNNYRMNAYLCVVFVGFSMCLAPARTKIITCSFHKLINMNEAMKILGIPYDYDIIFKEQIIQLSLALAAMSILVVLDLKYVGTEFPSETSRLGFLFFSHYLLIFSFVVDWSFSDLVRYFGNRFRRLNEMLIKSATLERSRPALTKRSRIQTPRYSSMINEIHQNYSSSITAAEKESLLYLVREIRRIHHGLCRTVIELNRAFSIQLLFSVALSFGLITSNTYSSFVLNTFLSSSSSVAHLLTGRMIAPMWITLHVTKIFLIVRACEGTSSEANRTGEFIGKLLGTSACDEDIRDEINIFSLQLIQNPLSFTARGFFNLDHALISRIIGSVTTYVIIMIQMRSIYEPEIMSPTSNSTIFIAHLNDTN